MARISFSSRSRRNGSKQSGAGGMMFGGAIFTLIGGIFTVVVAFMFLQALEQRGWNAVPAVLLTCEVQERQNAPTLDAPFILTASYRYQIDGVDHTSHNIKSGDFTDKSYEKLALQRAGFQQAEPLIAYVDPKDPSNSALLRESLWTGLIVFFPLIFVTIGIFLFRSGWKQRKSRGNQSADMPESLAAAAATTERNNKLGPVIGFIFCAIFGLVGLGLLYPMLIKPWQNSKDAGNWIETPAEVIWSRVTTHKSDDSTTYGIDIFYRYQFDGVEHKSNRYNFLSGSSSGYAGKKAVVDRYPVGHKFTCYVNPARPERAVIDRDGGIGFWFLIPLAFVIVGFAGMAGFAKTWLSKGLHGRPANSTRDAALTGNAAGRGLALTPDRPPQVEFQAGAKRWKNLIGTLSIALFWNGIVGVFVGVGLSDGSLFLFIFLIPFVLIGLFLIGSFFYCLLGLFNPRTNLLLRPGHPKLGETFVLRWHTHGSLGRLQNLTITVECLEKASYSRGTNRVTDKSIVFRQPVAELQPGLELREGRIDLNLPETLVPTWDGGSNQIEWRIQVKGEIKPGPDVNETHPITVLAATPS